MKRSNDNSNIVEQVNSLAKQCAGEADRQASADQANPRRPLESDWDAFYELLEKSEHSIRDGVLERAFTSLYKCHAQRLERSRGEQ